jgi:adenosylmethionine-8-amino-7-oxononanoate aminotransferase
MAFIAEPVVGATAGAVPSVPGYFTRIREICDRYGVLLILDEVMCGMGRTGTLFASEQDDVTPDIVTIAKGLGAGYMPIGAMLASARITMRLRPDREVSSTVTPIMATRFLPQPRWRSSKPFSTVA